MSKEDEMRPEPFFVQPDPEKPFFVQPRAEKLIRRGPCEYFIVGKTPDGRQINTRLTSVTFKTEGI
jgi:hypothetical protein